jgi:hypothetical protein
MVGDHDRIRRPDGSDFHITEGAMSVLYGRSTYKQLTDDILLDTNESLPLADVGPEIYVSWILRAEEELCKKLEVREEYILRYTLKQDEYIVQDRPPITAITTATPRMVTAAAHGIEDYSRILIAGVSGIDGINQQWFTYGKAANTFLLAPGAYISGIAEISTGIKVTTETPHGFTTGGTITLYGTGIDGDFVITVIDTTSFSIAVGVTGVALVSRACAIWKLQNAGTGDYVSGGRFWRDSEIPTFFQQIRVGYRKFGGLPRLLNPYSFEDIRLAQERDGYGIHTSYSAPDSMGFFRRNGLKYLKMWPLPMNESDVVLSGRMMIQSQMFRNDSENATIHLAYEYDEMIKAYVASKIYQRLKDGKQSMLEYSRFLSLVDDFREINKNPVRRPIVYYDN